MTSGSLQDDPNSVEPRPVGATYAEKYLETAAKVISSIDALAVERLAALLASLRTTSGRLFVVGSGGAAAHAAHAVADLRKIAEIEAYSPSDNIAELTARVNDDGWATSYVEWLRVSRLSAQDVLLVLSVGGGDQKRNVSPNLVQCLEYARQIGAKTCGIVGRDGGHTARMADVVVIVPNTDPELVTFHTEGAQSVLLHLLASHPAIKVKSARWESLR